MQKRRKVLEDWTIRWTEDYRRSVRVVRPEQILGPDRQSLKTQHQTGQCTNSTLGFEKQSSVLVQARTGRIGLAKCLEYCLYSADVGPGEETPRHMALYCTEEAERRQHLWMGRRMDYLQLIGTNGGARRLAEWTIRSGRLGQFSLAKRLLYG